MVNSRIYSSENDSPDLTTNASTNLEIEILSALGAAKEPLGAVSLSFKIKDESGYSQATIGRKLKEFDVRGLTKRKGYRGRVLTQEGEAYLKNLIDSIVMERRNEEFLDLLKNNSGDKLIQVLEARRALEREIVRLATLRMKKGDINDLEQIVAMQRQAIDSGETGTYENLAFHHALERIAQNQVLASALYLVRNQSNLILLMDVIRKRAGGVLVEDHEIIINAMREADPSLAAKAMTDHIDRIIDDVKKYMELEGEGVFREQGALAE